MLVLSWLSLTEGMKSERHAVVRHNSNESKGENKYTGKTSHYKRLLAALLTFYISVATDARLCAHSVINDSPNSSRIYRNQTLCRRYDEDNGGTKSIPVRVALSEGATRS